MAAATPSTSSAISSSSSSLLGGSRAGSSSLPPTSNLNTSVAQFREIHKNTWLKRLTADGKKITVGPKKSERNWVVFCVHDDAEAMLEGYAEPRQAASHSPEWIISMQDTLHISHSLIPNSNEFEFVVTLSNEVVRFHATSWEIMQEWVETLRSKLREMKILSPRENLYTKLPEVRAPLLPTRDPTSPLPAPPPVPAALVPGVERVIPQSILQANLATNTATPSTSSESGSNIANAAAAATTTTTASINRSNTTPTPPSPDANNLNSTSTLPSSPPPTISNTPLTSMSNTLSQNLLNMLSDPITAYSEHLNGAHGVECDVEEAEEFLFDANNISALTMDELTTPTPHQTNTQQNSKLISDAAASENSVRVDVSAAEANNAITNFLLQYSDMLLQIDQLIPRPQTSRSLSAGAAENSRKSTLKGTIPSNDRHSYELTTFSNDNITELEISTESPVMAAVTTTKTDITVANPINTTTTTIDNTKNPTTTTTAADSKTNITIIQVSTDAKTENANSTSTTTVTTTTAITDDTPPKLPVKNTTAEIFKFPETKASTKIKQQHEYKSNVQIIHPSNSNSSTIQVLSQDNNSRAPYNHYTTTAPVKKNITTTTVAGGNSTTTGSATSNSSTKVTTLHVAGDQVAIPQHSNINNTSSLSIYGTCFTPLPTTTTTTTSLSSSISMPGTPTLPATQSGTPKLPKKTILSANTSGITNITVNPTSGTESCPERFLTEAADHGNVHYEKLFLSSTIPISTEATPKVAATTSTTVLTTKPKPSPRHQVPSTTTQVNCSKNISDEDTILTPASPAHITSSALSPALQRRRVLSPPVSNQQPSLPTRSPYLTRGLTEAVITARPSRKDYYMLKLSTTKNKNNKNSISNNNDESSAITAISTPLHSAVTRTTTEVLEQRQRSSSTSDAHAKRNIRATNNNESSSSGGRSGLSIQQPPQPFRSVENGIPLRVALSGGAGGSSGIPVSPPATATPSVQPKRMTLREQQVMQLRREIMHPGGVRLQLRRKDTVGSIAWVDAFGAVWVAGWKQKEHPVLYNALHIGDQLLSIAGIAITSAAEANKVIRNTNTLFVEVLVRRIPFGRGYAIRRDREGQCLGLIRDGNTSTIVDVVPNSLAARHGLPPKSQSCDGTTLTFWVLTEINGRPLNLFFKENEIRDRLNSVGRDISILVQPSDLITKLKKQLKALRGYKDYLVQ